MLYYRNMALLAPASLPLSHFESPFSANQNNFFFSKYHFKTQVYIFEGKQLKEWNGSSKIMQLVFSFLININQQQITPYDGTNL